MKFSSLRKMLLPLVLIFTCFTAKSQSNYSKGFSNEWSANILLSASVNNNASFIECSDPTNSLEVNPVRLVELTPSGEISRATLIYADTTVIPFGWENPINYKRADNTHAFQLMGELILSAPDLNKGGLFVINPDQNIAWGKRTAQGIFNQLTLDINNETVVCSRASAPLNSPSDTVVSASSFELQTGNSRWENNYKISPSTGPSPTGYIVKDIALDNNNISYILGELLFPSNQRQSFLLQLSPDGSILNNAIITHNELTSLDVAISNQGNIVIAGILEGGNGSLIVLDQELEVMWARSLQSDKINYANLQIFINNGIIFFFTVDPQFIPVIAGQFTLAGELLANYGYATEFPSYNIDTEGHVHLLSPNIFVDDAVQFGYQIIRENPLSDTSCIRFPSCLDIENIDITLSSSSWHTQTAFPLPDFSVSSTEFDLNTYDFCSELPPITPHFQIADTICYGQSIAPTELENKYANSVEWHINGPMLDTVIVDTSFALSPSHPGSYTVKHTIWILGCSYSSQKELVVLPDNLEVMLPDSIFSCTENYIFNIQTNRPLRGITWEDGSNLFSRNISIPGNFSFIASDGFCEARDTINIDFLSHKYPEPQLILPNDTSICKEDLPLQIIPYSPYASLFSFNNIDIPAGPIFLEEGEHSIQIAIEDCIVAKNIAVTGVECKNIIYFPNVFSPNGDGVNDYWQAEGSNFEALELSIFDRWGGSIFSTDTPPFRWDGSNSKRDLNNGQFIAKVTYLNTITESIITHYQSILLIR